MTFGQLAIAAAEDETAVDRSALLEAADAFLNAANGGLAYAVLAVGPHVNTTGLELGRGMAFRAMEWAVFGTPETHAALVRAVGAFRMYTNLKA